MGKADRRSRPLEHEGVLGRPACGSSSSPLNPSRTSLPARPRSRRSEASADGSTRRFKLGAATVADDRIRAIQERVTNTPDAYAARSTARRARSHDVPRSAARVRPPGTDVGCIIALAALKAGGAGSHVTTDVLAGVLAVGFIALTLVDFRLSVAVTIFELALGGAGGHWVDYGSLSGRLFLISVVTARAAWLTFVAWRHRLHPVLGRYGAHALAIAVLVPAVWMSLGLAQRQSAPQRLQPTATDSSSSLSCSSSSRSIREGEGAWLLRLFFAACATGAILYSS